MIGRLSCSVKGALYYSLRRARDSFVLNCSDDTVLGATCYFDNRRVQQHISGPTRVLDKLAQTKMN